MFQTRLSDRLNRQVLGDRRVLVPLLISAGATAGVAGGVLTAAVSPVAGVAVVFGVGAGLAMLANTQVGLIAFIGIAYMLPFAVLPVPIGGVKLTFVDATLSTLLAVWILRLLARPEQRLIGSPLDILVCIFIGLAVTSFVIGVNSVTAEIARFFLKTINSILFFFSVTNCVRSRGQLIQVTRALLLAAAGAAALALLLYFITHSMAIQLLSTLRVLGYPSGPGVLRFIAGTETLRAIGTSIDPNVLGGMLVLATPMAVAHLFAKGPALPHRFLVPMVGAMSLALVLTFSRSSWIGVIAAVLFLATLRYRRLWIICVLFAVGLFLLPQGEVILGRMQSGIMVQDQAAAMRMGEYKDALRLIARYPWFGVGFGSAPTIDLYIGASSVYLLIAEEMGLIGLASFSTIMLVLLIYALRAASKITDPRLQTLQLGALAGLVGSLVAGFFDHYFFNLYFPHTVALLWLFAGLTVVATRLGLEVRDPPSAGS